MAARFDGLLASRGAPRESWGERCKLVRFYLHFCEKYRHDPRDITSLSPFLDKLKTKGQTEEQRNCASISVELYRALLLETGKPQEKQEAMAPSMAEELPAGYEKTHSSSESPMFVSAAAKPFYGMRDVSRASTFKSGAGTPQSKDASHQTHPDNCREEANADWREIEAGLKSEIMLRRYSPKTYKTSQSMLNFQPRGV